MVQKSTNKKMKVINQEYYNQQTALSESAKQELALARRHRLKMMLIASFFLLVTIFLGWNIIQNNIQATLLNQKTQAQKVELKKTKQQNKELNQKVAQLKDSDYVAKIIRKKYYFSKDGETIYSLPSDKANTVTDN